jgi:hypothetical protein
VSDQVTHTCRTTGITIFPYILNFIFLNSKLKAKGSAVGKLLIILNAVAAVTVQLYVPKNVSR